MINISNIKLKNNVILAPMSGVTDLPFRKLVKRFGVGLLVSEMVASRAMIAEYKLQKGKAIKKSAILSEDPTLSCVQIAGCEPEVMAEAARINEDLGASIIDINFGCPAKKIVNNYSGSYLMRDEKLAAEIITAVVKAVKVPVTLKMRMGWDESSKNAPSIARIAEDIGVQMITVHGRTRCQFYSGIADWGFISKVKDVVKVPVIANGDIVSVEGAVRALDESRADGVMIGRGAYGKPWFPSQVASYLDDGKIQDNPTNDEIHETVMEHYEDILEHYGIEAGIKIARKHMSWYSASHKNSSDFRAKINLCADHVVAQSIIKDFFSNIQ